MSTPRKVSLDSSAHRKVLLYWIDYAKGFGGVQKNAYQTFDKLDTEWPNLEGVSTSLRDLAGIPGPLKDEIAARGLITLEYALHEFLSFRGYWDEGLLLNEWAHEAATLLGAWQDAGSLARGLAFGYSRRGNLELSNLWTQRMAEAYTRSGSAIDRAMVLRMKGILARVKGELDEAERFSAEALLSVRSLGDKRAEALLLSDLGALESRRARYIEAERYLLDALSIFEHESEKRGQTPIFGRLGALALVTGQTQKAQDWYARELSLARELGNQLLLADALSGSASVLEALNCPDEALPLAQEALKIKEKIRSADLGGTSALVLRLRDKATKGSFA